MLPTGVIVSTLNEAYRHYYSFPRHDGCPRKETNQRIIRLDGEDRSDNMTFGFARKWDGFREAWDLLFSPRKRSTGSADRGPFTTIGALCEHMLLDPELTYSQILDRVRETFPAAKTTEHCLNWYATKLRREGHRVAGKAERARASV